MKGMKVVIYTLFFLIFFLVADLVSIFTPILVGDVYIQGRPVPGDGRVIYRYPMKTYLKHNLMYKTPELSVGLISARVARTTSILNGLDAQSVLTGVLSGQTATKLINSAHNHNVKIAVAVEYYIGLDVKDVMIGDNIFQACSSSSPVILSSLSFMSNSCKPEGYQWVDDANFPYSSKIKYIFVKGNYRDIKKFLRDNGINLVTPSYLGGMFFLNFSLGLLVFSVVLLLITIIAYVSMLRMSIRKDVVKNSRRFFVYYALGRSLRDLSLWALSMEMLQVFLAIIFAWLLDRIFDEIRYIPLSHALTFVMGLRGKVAYYYIAPSITWRLILVVFFALFVALFFYYLFREDLKGAFYRRGVAVLPSSIIVTLSFVVTSVMIILAIWGVTVFTRLHLIQSVYSPSGYVVQDNDLELSLLDGHSMRQLVKSGSVSLARVIFVASENTLYTCYTPDMKSFIDRQLPLINTLWADGKAQVIHDCRKITNSILYADGVLDITYVPSNQVDKFVGAYISIKAQMHNEIVKHAGVNSSFNANQLKENIRYMFYRANNKINRAMERGYFIFLSFSLVSLLIFLAFMIAIAEIMLKLMPFRLAVYMISGYTLRQGLKSMMSRLLKWITLASVVGGLLGYWLATIIWRKLGWNFPSAIWVLAVVIFIPAVSYLGMELATLRLRKEGVVKILKADL